MQDAQFKLFADITKAMELGEPQARYIKAILGRISVHVIDTITSKPSIQMMIGDPSETPVPDSCIITLWTPIEVAFFQRMNPVHLAQGNLVPYIVDSDAEITESPNSPTDEMIREAVSKRFFAIKNMVDKFTTIAPAMRALAIAREMNATIGKVSYIEKRISQLQDE